MINHKKVACKVSAANLDLLDTSHKNCNRLSYDYIRSGSPTL